MTNRLFSLMAGVALLALAGTANAGQPLKLTNGQMDAVAAGSLALANAGALAFGELTADTLTQTATVINKVGPIGGQVVASAAQAQGLAVGGYLFNVGSTVSAQSAAQW
jgi:hypothetical protein